MKQVYRMVVVLVIVFALCLPICAEEQIILSEMSEMECVEFVKSHGVEIPDDYDEETWGPS